MARAARLERAPSRSSRRAACRRVRAGAAARQLDTNLHGQRGDLPGPVLPVVSAWRPVRQAHGRQRLRVGHRGLHDRTAGRAPRRAGGRTRRCSRNLWRRQPVRCFLCARPHGAGVVSISVHSAPLDASGDHAGHLHLHDVSPAGNASDSECDPDAIFRHTPFAAPGLGIVASAIMLGFGLWWLGRAERVARRAGEGYGAPDGASVEAAADDPVVRELATTAREFDPAEIHRGQHGDTKPPVARAFLPLVVVVSVNLLMSLVLLPRLDFSFLAEERWGSTSLSAVAGVWAVVVALTSAIATLIAINYRYFPALRASMDAGANASVLPAVTIASLVGFGAVVAALPAFAAVRDWVLSMEGGPLVSLAVATNVLAALTGSASGGLTIALDALGNAYMELAAGTDIDPALMHRVAVIGSGTLDSLPHNGAVVTLLALCGLTHRESYFDIVMVAIVGAIIALVAVIALGSAFGSF